MGMSSSKSKTTNKPIYSAQIEGAGNTLTSAYNANAPKIQANTDMVTGLLPGMIDQYKAGDAGINAARGYAVDTLGGKYLDQGNPYLDRMAQVTGNNVSNQLGARLAKMGLGPAGSSYQGTVGKALADSELGMRYSDYNAERGRMGEMASLTPALAGADASRIAPVLGVADAANAPVRAAVGYSSGLGGLLGQYQETKTKTTEPWGKMVLEGLNNAAKAYAGGG